MMLGEYIIKIIHTCINCGSGNTYVDKNGCVKWHRYQNGFRCERCYRKSKYIPRPRQVISRICSNCDSDKTYTDKNGFQHWYKHNGGSWYCNNCNNRLFKNPNRGDKKKRTLDKKGEVSKKTHPIKNNAGGI